MPRGPGLPLAGNVRELRDLVERAIVLSGGDLIAAGDIAGGLMVAAPSEAVLRDEKLGPYVKKYLRGVETVPTKNRLRLIGNLCLGTAAVGYRTGSMHGAGSPQAQRIMIAREGNLEGKKALAHIREQE